uniref:C-type lectin domain-containing protein n=1 Tax=Gopherus agassizii TaxID=38772 RepID=A0A452HUI9_9SAUR
MLQRPAARPPIPSPDTNSPYPPEGHKFRAGLGSSRKPALGDLTGRNVMVCCCFLAVNSSSGKGSYGSPPPEACPADWLYHQRKCYYFSETEKDWDSSWSFCSSHNSSLTVIENQQELNFIMKITKQDPWIGLHKTGEEFHWVNGTPLDRNLLAVKGSGECAYIESDVVSSSGCSLTRGWVCKKTS